MQENTTTSDRDRALRDHVRYLLRGGGAHIDLRSALESYPLAIINAKTGDLPYTPWQVLDHMRIAQRDILEFSRNPDHVSPDFPEGYWPPAGQEADKETWNLTVAKLLSDSEQMEELVMSPETDLFVPIPHGDGQTILREALLIADHNAYHLGSLMTMKKSTRKKSTS
jgi:DinB superfamily